MVDSEDENPLPLAGTPLAALRSRWCIGERTQSPGSLFLSLQRQWRSSGGAGRTAGFLRTVAACELHIQLLGYVLQFHACDAVRILEELALVEVVEHDCFSADEFDDVAPVVEALVAAAMMLMLSINPQAAERRNKLKRRIQVVAERNPRRCSALHNALELLSSDRCGRDVELWRAFEALPFEPDSQLSSTRSGRARVQIMDAMLHQQQDAVHRTVSYQDSDIHEQGVVSKVGENESAAADRLWAMAHDLLDWIEERSARDGKSSDGAMNDGRAKRSWECASAVLLTEADLEAYLISTSPHAEHKSDIDAADLKPALQPPADSKSSIQTLLEACSTDGNMCGVSLPSGLLTAAYDQLAAERDLKRLQVQATYLLAWQIEAGHSFAGSSRQDELRLERLLQREFNSLTVDGGQLEAHLSSLLALSPFCPTRLIELVVRGAQADNVHHVFFLDLLAACPLLVEWEDGRARSSEERSVLKRELQRMVHVVTSSTEQPEAHAHDYAVAFLAGLVGASDHPSANRVLLLLDVLQDVLFPRLDGLESQAEGLLDGSDAFNVFSLVRQLLNRATTARPNNGSLSLGDSGIGLLQRTAGAYAVASSSSTSESARFREVLLLLIKDVLELLAVEGLLLSEALAAALASIFVRASDLCSDAAFCMLTAPIGLPDAAVSVAVLHKRGKADNALSGNALTLCEATRDAEAALWGLLWASLLSNKLATFARVTESELWEALDALASWSSLRDESATIDQPQAAGASVIQSAAASLLLSSGESLTRSFRDNVVPFLMKYEHVDATRRGADSLSRPFGRNVSPNNIQDGLACSLSSLHCVARFFGKCWGLMALEHHRTHPNLLLEMLRGAISACDVAVGVSAENHLQLLACLEWECYLAYSASELGLGSYSSWSEISTQLEMSLLRVLHRLSAIKQLSASEAAAASELIAAWLSVVPFDGSFAAVSRFLQANQDRGR